MRLEQQVEEVRPDDTKIVLRPTIDEPSLYITEEGELCAEGYTFPGVLCRVRFNKKTTEVMRAYFYNEFTNNGL